jgi:hypothetical protein
MIIEDRLNNMEQKLGRMMRPSCYTTKMGGLADFRLRGLVNQAMEVRT